MKAERADDQPAGRTSDVETLREEHARLTAEIDQLQSERRSRAVVRS